MKQHSLIKHGWRWLHAQRDLIMMFSVGALLPILQAVDWPWLRIPLGVIAVLFAPGYVLLAVWVPDEAVLERTARLALSIGLSIAVLPLLALILDSNPGGLLPERIVCMLSVWISGWATLAVLLRSRQALAQPATRKVIQVSWRWLRQALVAGVACLVLGLGCMILVRGLKLQPVTAFYVLGPTGKAEGYAPMLAPSQSISLTLGLSNGDLHEQHYHVVLETNGKPQMLVAPFRVAGYGHWQQTISINLAPTEAVNRLDLLLFKEGTSQPIRQLALSLRAAP